MKLSEVSQVALRYCKVLVKEEYKIKLQLINIIIGQKVISRIEKGERFVADYELLGFSQVLGVDLYWLCGINRRPQTQ